MIRTRVEMAMRSVPTPKIEMTCDVCGAVADGPGVTGWWKITQHPDGVDTTILGALSEWDICSTACLVIAADRTHLDYG